MITGTQIRGARAMTGMSIEALADASGLTAGEIAALEDGGDDGEHRTLSAVKQALEAAGIIFIASGNHDEGGPGIRLKARDAGDDGLRPEELNATNDD